MNAYQLRKMGFKFMDSPQLDEHGRIIFSVRRGEFCGVVYAILVNDRLVYIGQTSDFFVRKHTYRNAKYWKNAWRSNKLKTSNIESNLKRGLDVSFYCLNSANVDFDERLLIENLSPKWNKVYCNSRGI